MDKKKSQYPSEPTEIRKEEAGKYDRLVDWFATSKGSVANKLKKQREELEKGEGKYKTE